MPQPTLIIALIMLIATLTRSLRALTRSLARRPAALPAAEVWPGCERAWRASERSRAARLSL